MTHPLTTEARITVPRLKVSSVFVTDEASFEITQQGVLSIRIPVKTFIELIGTVDPGPSRLTIRQRQVLDMVVKNATNKEIAQTLGMTERTVKFHVTGLLEIFGVTSRRELLMHAYALPPGIEKP
jgi:DNA-binding CsgD family transcriptional regulator